MHRIPLYMPAPSILWDKTLPEYVLFEKTLFRSNYDETVAFFHILDDEANFYKEQCYGIAAEMFAKAKACIASPNEKSITKGMHLISFIILRTPKDSPILARALRIRGNLWYFNSSFENASNDYEMFLEVNQFTRCPLQETCAVMGNLIVCMYMKRQLVKAKKYWQSYQNLKAKMKPKALQKNCFVQIDKSIEDCVNAFNELDISLPRRVKEKGCCDIIKPVTKTYSKNNKNMFAESDIQAHQVIFADSPFLKSFNAPFIRCEACFSLCKLQPYTCLDCRYKTYCSYDCMKKNKPTHKDECLGLKQLTLLLIDASGIYLIFKNTVLFLHENILKMHIFRGKKTAGEIWNELLKIIEKTELNELNYCLSFIKTAPQYERLMARQYSTLITSIFRIAIFIDYKTELIETCFQSLDISPKQKLILVGSLLMRIHCNVLLNTYDFEVQSDVHTEEFRTDVAQTPTLTGKNTTYYADPVVDLQQHFNIDIDKDIWKRSACILRVSGYDSQSINLPCQMSTAQNQQSCSPINRILSIYKDKITQLVFNPNRVQTAMYGATSWNPIDQTEASELYSHLNEMKHDQRCEFLKKFARHFHNHYTEYFLQLSQSQMNQMLSLYSPMLRKLKHSCNPNVEIIVLDNGIIVGKSLRHIRKDEQLYVAQKAHYMLHMKSERLLFLERFNISCECEHCKISHLIDPVNQRRGIFCESCENFYITPQQETCPKCNTQYNNLLTKYLSIISVFENELNNKRKSEKTTEREIFILHNIIYSHAKKYFVSTNEFRILCALRYARYLALKNFAKQSYKLIFEIRNTILQSYSEHFVWFTYYNEIIQIIKIILGFSVDSGLYTLHPSMLIRICDLGLHIVRGQVDVIDFYELFDSMCPFVLNDLSLFLKWKDKIVCTEVLSLAQALKDCPNMQKECPDRYQIFFVCCLFSKEAIMALQRYMGVNAQYYRDHRIEIETLEIIELHKRRTGLNFSVEIENILKEFSVSKQQIYTKTSDNEKNIKSVELLIYDIDTALNDDVDDKYLLIDVRVQSIASIKCAAHSLQLAVKEFLKDDRREVIIDKARKVVKILRTPTYRLAISSLGLPQPLVDVPTRWNSIFSMLKNVCMHKVERAFSALKLVLLEV